MSISNQFSPSIALIGRPAPRSMGSRQLPSGPRGLRNPRPKELVTALLREAGVVVNGPNPWDIQVHDERFYDRALREGDLGVGESYTEGWWDCDRLDELTCRMLSHDLLTHAGAGWRTTLAGWKRKLFNLQTRRRATRVARVHYDLSNAFFEQMLGPTMAYSCGYWKHAAHLDEAQEHKHDLICRKLQIDRGDHVLDIGCGWGAFARFAARNYGCHVTGITISAEQYAYARDFCAGLPVDIMRCDYREPALRSRGPFDKLVSVGMFEHVGRKNHRTFMTIAHDLLSDHGLFLAHTIGATSSSGIGAWIERYIFPNSDLPRLSNIVRAIDGLFVMEDWQNFGAYYDKTLMSWLGNIESHPAARELLTDRGLYRRWRYYLLTCAGAFRQRSRTQVWQVVLSKHGVRGGYDSVR